MPPLLRATVWFISGLLIAGGVGWVSAKVQSTGFAPVGISSLVVGAVLGVLLAVVSNQLGVRRKSVLLIVVALVALFAVTSQHVAAYCESVRLVEQQVHTDPGAMWFGSDMPTGPREFVDREILANPNIVGWWLLDGVLIIMGVCVAFWLIAEKKTGLKKEIERPPDETKELSDT